MRPFNAETSMKQEQLSIILFIFCVCVNALTSWMLRGISFFTRLIALDSQKKKKISEIYSQNYGINDKLTDQKLLIYFYHRNRNLNSSSLESRF